MITPMSESLYRLLPILVLVGLPGEDISVMMEAGTNSGDVTA